MALEIIVCPKCGQRVVAKRDGRCPSCQETIAEASAMEVYPASPPTPELSAATPDFSATSRDPAPLTGREGRVIKRRLVFAMLLMLPFGWLLADSILGNPSPTRLASRRVRNLENALGPHAMNFLSGVVGLGFGLYLTHCSVRQATRRGRLLGYGLALTAAGTGFSFVAVPKAVAAQERGRLREVVAQLQPLCKTDSVANEWQKYAIGEKLVVWDCHEGDLHPAHEKLPDSRRGNSGDARVTYLLVLKRRDEKDATYESGEIGYSRTMQIGVIDWPDKRLLGVFELEGRSPDTFLFRGKDDDSPIIGDTVAPVLDWIDRQTP